MPSSQPRSRPERLDGAFATPDAKYRYTRRLFATIADRYDLITRLLSFGQDQRWKRELIAMAGVTRSSTVLDLACGTGDLALLAADRGASVAALDFTAKMIELARQKTPGHGTATGQVRWIVGDMADLPIADRSFDVVTTGYGLRNVPDLTRAVKEIHRVLAPGGVLCSLDFNRPRSRIVRAVYLAYLYGVGSTLGWVLHGDADTYRYIPASIGRHPGRRELAAMMTAVGFRNVRHVPVLGGFMTIHVARK